MLTSEQAPRMETERAGRRREKVTEDTEKDTENRSEKMAIPLLRADCILLLDSSRLHYTHNIINIFSFLVDSRAN